MHLLFAHPGTPPEEWVAALRAALPEHRVSIWNPNAPATGADVALVWKPPANLFTHETQLKTIFNLGAGVDAVLALPTFPADARLIRLEDAGMAVQMAEYVLFALARASRDFDVYDAQQRAGQWQPAPGTLRADWPVGILGLGRIGLQVAQTLASLGYDVAGWSRSGRDDVAGMTSYAGAEALPAFLARTRVLVNVLPLTAETRGFIDASVLAQLKSGAHVINVGRGESLVEKDLLAALASGQVAGASLDVFETEPLPQDHPFWRDARVHITPHVAARTLLEESIAQIASKVRALAAGQPITGIVSRDRGY